MAVIEIFLVYCITSAWIDNNLHLVSQADLQINKPDSPVQCSKDGFLKQSSTRADTVPIRFAGSDEVQAIPAAFIEFVWRQILPERANEAADLSRVRCNQQSIGSRMNTAVDVCCCGY